MNDSTPSREMIEQAQRAYAANLEHGSFAAMEQAIAAALTASPLPGDVEEAAEDLRYYKTSGCEECSQCRTLERGASLLERMARENGRLNATVKDFEFTFGIKDDRIREIEADLKQHAELNAAEHQFMLKAHAERDAIRAKTIKECETALLVAAQHESSGKCCDNCNCLGLKRGLEAIRALGQPASEDGKE